MSAPAGPGLQQVGSIIPHFCPGRKGKTRQGYIIKGLTNGRKTCKIGMTDKVRVFLTKEESQYAV